MKKRVRKIANFFAFNLLFFALYLNFVHKDQSVAVSGSISVKETAAPLTGSVVSANSIDNSQAVAEQASVKRVSADNSVPLKLSIN